LVASNARLEGSPMDINEILSQLERNEGYFPKAAVQEAIEHREEMIPILLGVLEDVARDPIPYTKERRIIHIYAMYLLAQFREPRAYPLLVRIFSAPGELAFDLAGDVVTERLGRILASVSDGDMEGMKSLVENAKANKYVRSAGMDGLVTLVACGRRSREEVMAYFKSLFHTFPRDLGDEWASLVCACADLYPREVKEEIRQAYEDDLVEPMIVDWEDVKYELSLGKNVVMERLRRYNKLIENVVDELENWVCFDKDASEVGPDEEPFAAHPVRFDEPTEVSDLVDDFEDDESFDEDDEDAELDDGFDPPLPDSEPPGTFRRAQPKVGRNDPCPCGSGLKFKKCCGR